MAATGSRVPASATPKASSICSFALATAFSEIALNSVCVTNCASVSVTGGGVAILCSLELGYMKAPLSEDKRNWQADSKYIDQERSEERRVGKECRSRWS